MPTLPRSRALIVGTVLVLLVAAFSVNYTVDRGDTLGQIAKDNGVSLSALIEANDITNPDLIYPGQVLIIPGKDGKPDTRHVVTRGETLNGIAAQYGASVSRIVAANDIANPDLIRVGQRLLIPSPSKSGSSGSSGSGSGSSGSGDESQGISDRHGKYHVVKRGETVEAIAAQYSGVSAADIIKANGIVKGVIYAGAAMYLSGPGYIASGSSGSSKYTVKSGDRLVDIANQFNVSLSKLIAKNDISNPNVIRAGQVLVIPKGSAWVCPVKGPSYMNDWGFPRDGGSRYHEGNDLFVASGTPVRAPVSGTVRFKTGSIGGLQFTLSADDGIVYIGSHMSKFGKDGKVQAGDVIGYVGNTGNAAGSPSHLHFGMYYKGTPVNPYPSLVKNSC